MYSKTALIALVFALGVLVGALGLEALYAQQAGIKRRILQQVDLAVPGREGVMGHAEVPPGMSAGKHYHHGDELGYMLEGTAVLEVEGQAPVTLTAGEVYFIAAGKTHDARSIGDVPARVLAIYVVEKGKPLAVPVP